jgi:hypothetical protein
VSEGSAWRGILLLLWLHVGHSRLSRSLLTSPWAVVLAPFPSTLIVPKAQTCLSFLCPGHESQLRQGLLCGRLSLSKNLQEPGGWVGRGRISLTQR